MRTAATACAVWLCAWTASAQESADTLFITGQADFLQAGTGGNGAVEWLRKTDQRGVHGGVQSGSRAGAWWTYGRVGGFGRRGRTVFAGTVDAGGGVRQGARFGYQKVAGDVAVALVAGRIVLETEGQLARMAPDLRRILRVGIKWRAAPAVSTGVSYYLVSIDRRLTPALSARIDVEQGRTSILGGVVLARRDGPAALLSDVGGTPLTSTECFGGGGLRTRSYRLQMIATVARSRADASRLMVSLEIPLKR